VKEWRWSLATKLSIAVSLILLAVVSVTALLHYFRFESSLREVTEARLRLHAAEISSRIQGGLDLGLDLPAITNIQEILDSERAIDPAIAAIEVFNAQGRPLYRSAAGNDAPLTEEELGQLAASKAKASEDDDSGEVAPVPAAVALLGASQGRLAAHAGLTDIFGQEAGSVVLSYSGEGLAGSLRAMARLLLLLALGLILGGSLLAHLATRRIVRAQVRGLERMRQSLEAVLDARPAPLAISGDTALERDLGGSSATLRLVLDELDATASIPAPTPRGA
jgi:hypothetical protein